MFHFRVLGESFTTFLLLKNGLRVTRFTTTYYLYVKVLFFWGGRRDPTALQLF